MTVNMENWLRSEIERCVDKGYTPHEIAEELGMDEEMFIEEYKDILLLFA